MPRNRAVDAYILFNREMRPSAALAIGQEEIADWTAYQECQHNIVPNESSDRYFA